MTHNEDGRRNECMYGDGDTFCAKKREMNHLVGLLYMQLRIMLWKTSTVSWWISASHIKLHMPFVDFEVDEDLIFRWRSRQKTGKLELLIE